MIQRKLKLCKCGCGKEGYIWARGYLKGHEPNYNSKVKAANGFIKREKNKTGELEMFLNIWTKMKPAKEMTKSVEELEAMNPIEYFEYIQQFKVCAITLEPLSIFYVGLFSHILCKKKYKRFMLEPFNIKVVKYEIHQIWEFQTREKLLEYVGGRKIGEYYDYLQRKYNGQV